MLARYSRRVTRRRMFLARLERVVLIVRIAVFVRISVPVGVVGFLTSIENLFLKDVICYV